MPPKKKPCVEVDQTVVVFVVTAATTENPVPRDVRRVRIHGSVRVLPDEIFKDCTSLEEVVFEEGVHTIGKRAFGNCRSLDTVKLPSTLEEIHSWAFDSCEELTSIDLPVGLVVIREYAFRKTKLMQLEVPSTVETIGKAAFWLCTSLESIVLPPRLGAIAPGLFMHCHRLREVQIPSTIESIGDMAFNCCRALQSLDLSHCVDCVVISLLAINGCSELSFLHLPPNLRSIRDRAFKTCRKLTHVRIPRSVTSIANKVNSPFSECKSLVSIEIPESMESIKVIPDIAKSESLVNLYLPSSQEVAELDDSDPFPKPEDFELAKVATGWRDLEAKLQNRFDGRPLHKLCFFHSYHPVEDTIEEIQSILQLNPDAAAEVDTLGMTPLHIFSLAQKPVVSLLEELPDIAKMALSSKDFFGSTPLVYLCKNPLREGTTAARWMIRTILEKRLPFLGLDRWKQELLEAEKSVRLPAFLSTVNCEEGSTDNGAEVNDSANADTDENQASEQTLCEVEDLLDKLARFELLEVVSLLEMVLWRIKLNGKHIMVEEDDAKMSISGREGCRVQCGMSIVVANVLPFLGK